MSIAQLEQEIAALKASLGALEAAKNAALQEIRRLGEEKAELRAASQRQLAGGDTAGHAALRSQEARLDEVIGEAYSGPAFKNLEAAESKIRSLESQLYQAQQKAKFEAEKNTPVVASPAPVPPEDTGTVPPGGGNTTPPPPTAPGTSPPAAPPKAAPEPPTQTQGVAASGPQGPSNTSPGTNTSGNLNADGAIEPQPNILDRFASYTYSASVYLMSTKQYKRLLRSKKKNINGYNLLFQSGGAPTNVGGFLGKGTGSVNGQDPGAEFAQEFNDQDYGRNPAFPQDFYIDSITIDNALPGRQTKAAHMVTNLKFTVIEPGNISLLDRLYAAVQDMGQTAGENQPINYTATAYLMVLRWYGYDANGNLVAGRTAPDPKTGLTDTNAIVEKFIPFLIKKINWSVGSKLVTYEFECAPIGQLVAGGTRRGTVPYDVQLTATSVGELLGGNAVYSSGNAPASAPGQSTTQPVNNQSSGYYNSSSAPTASTQSVNNQSSGYYNSAAAPSKANAAADKKIIKLGLMGAMNEIQQRLVADDIYRKADTYEIVFVPGRDGKQNIRDAQIRLPGARVEQSQTGMGIAASQNANQSLDEKKIALNISSRNWSVKAGMQLVQAIDLAIRNSSYIYNQALTTYNENPGTETLNPDRTTPLQWFKINMEAEQGDYDKERNDYSYKIRFIISEYEVPNFDSKYFPVSKFRGVYKSYPFWFTGQNTAVIDFQANFNGLYNITVTGKTPQNSQAAKMREKTTASMREIPKYTYMSASSESRMGADGNANEIPSNASEYLYSPGDLANSKIRIIGDPAWIQQGDLAGGVSVAEFSYSPFLPDGTINFDANQVLYEIAWQRPRDYNIATGLADPYLGAVNGEARLPLQSTVYQATKVISEFRQGKFEQTIEGELYSFPLPSKTNTAAATAVNNQSDAETARLNRSGNAGANPGANAGGPGGGPAGANQTAASAARLGQPNTSTAGAGRGSTDAFAALLPGGAGGGRGFVNPLANGARAAVGPPAPNTNSASAPPPPPPPGFPIGPLSPALPPISNGVIVGPASQILGPTIGSQLRQLDRRQNGRRDN